MPSCFSWLTKKSKRGPTLFIITGPTLESFYELNHSVVDVGLLAENVFISISMFMSLSYEMTTAFFEPCTNLGYCYD